MCADAAFYIAAEVEKRILMWYNHKKVTRG